MFRKILATVLLTASAAIAQGVSLPVLRFSHPLEVGISRLEVEIRTQVTAPFTLELSRLRGGVSTLLTTASVAGRYHGFTLASSTMDADGYTVRLVGQGGLTTAEFTEVVRPLRGDFNLDGEVNVADALAILAYISGQPVAVPFSTVLGDVQPDGQLNIADSVAILDFLFNGGAAPAPYDLPGQFAAPGTEASADVQALIAALGNQTDPNLADYAYTRLHHIGDPAVTPLINAATAVAPGTLFAGGKCFHPESSSAGLPVRVASLCLLLVDSMRLGYLAPFGYPEFHGAGGGVATTGELATIAADYTNWNLMFASWPVWTRPLVTPSGSWLPPITDGPFCPEWTDPQWGTPVPGSPTWGGSFRLCTPRVPVTDPSGTVLYWVDCWFTIYHEPPEVYAVKETNCAAHALGGSNWRWFGGPSGGSLEGMLEEGGYDPEGSPDPTAPATDHIAVIHWLCPEQEPSSATAKHIMKQQPNGKWSSKNGHGYLYVDICDIMDFIKKGKHYENAPPGKTIHIQYHRPKS